MSKVILDVCCGIRSMWFHKEHPRTVYLDKRTCPPGFSKHKPTFSVMPDLEVNWDSLPYEDNTFKLVVMDPPHMFGKPESPYNMIQHYGHLDKENWQQDIKSGFDECWRVLDEYGVLIFKWSEAHIPKSEVVRVLDRQPLFGHPNGSRVPCHWLTFMKFPNDIGCVCRECCK